MKISELSHITETDLNELAPSKNNPMVQQFVTQMNQDKYAGHNLKDFLKFMQKNGFTALGSGGFGATFTHPKLQYIIKVFKNDVGYLKFIKYCFQNPQNINLPKFRGKPMTIDSAHYMVRLEHLDPVHTRAQRQAIVIATLIDLHWIELEDMSQFEEEEYENYGEGFELLRRQPDFAPTIIQLRKISGKTDFTENNFMVRGDTLVITDPLWG